MPFIHVSPEPSINAQHTHPQIILLEDFLEKVGNGPPPLLIFVGGNAEFLFIGYGAGGGRTNSGVGDTFVVGRVSRTSRTAASPLECAENTFLGGWAGGW